MSENIFFQIFISLIAGVGAGLGTGFAGMSAAAAISPMLIVFLGVEPFQAVAISLASDVIASAVSAYTYGKNKNINFKSGWILMITVLIFTIVGTYVASLVPSKTMGSFSSIMTLLLGLKFVIKPVMNTKEKMNSLSKNKMIIFSILGGILIGFICGFVGAGGGMMMLLILTSVLGYELKTAVGTSVFIMTFTALIGAGSHIAISAEVPNLVLLITCVISTLLFARIAAKIATKAQPKTLNRITGIVLIIISIAVITMSIVQKLI